MSAAPLPEYLLCPAALLRAFTARCYESAGMTPEEAAIAGNLLVRTELRGVETHGVQWLPSYCRALIDGRMNPRPRVRVTRDLGATSLVDGDAGLGHVVSFRAMEACIARARELGLGCAAVRNSRHNGAASLYALQALEAGMIGLSLTGGGVRVAPAGGRVAMLGTNPLAFAAPARDEPPFVLDMATSVVAGAKVALHQERGLPIPLGWALDPEGRPTTSAEAGGAGPLLPLGGLPELGGHKGFALGLMIETLCNLLTGMASGPERARAAAGEKPSYPEGSGHFLLALRIDGFEDPDAFRRRMDANLRLLRDCPPLDGFDRVYTPGELEWRRERDREVNGVPVSRVTAASLNALAVELGVEPLPLG